MKVAWGALGEYVLMWAPLDMLLLMFLKAITEVRHLVVGCI